MTTSNIDPEENMGIYNKMARGAIWLRYGAIVLCLTRKKGDLHGFVGFRGCRGQQRSKWLPV
jgi:hypothetical protein